MDREALRAIRIYHGMTQSQLAEALGISKSCVASAESGYRSVSDNLRVRVAQKFGMSEEVVRAVKDARTSADLR
ncbi:helix-turn-helix transcriptional regulator [Acinetobacter sp. CUI P1]|nr:helix-turn-helix transcriptional regulator [Acinetobacter sp. CUI P1]